MSHLPSAAALLASAERIQSQRAQQSRLWTPSLQIPLLATPQSLVQPQTIPQGATTLRRQYELGRKLVLMPDEERQKMFLTQYTNPAFAETDLRQSATNAVNAHKNLTLAMNIAASSNQCGVFPPLLIRYNGAEDKYIPVRITNSSGEIHAVRDELPDMIVNFHAQSRAITLTVCRIDSTHMEKYFTVLDVMYSIAPVANNEVAVTIEEFTKLYDQHRAEYLHNLK